MSWSLSKYSSSLMSRLRRSRPKPGDKERIMAIRQAMLDELTEVNERHKLTRVYVRIVFAPDIQALWYLRCDMMTLLAKQVGESVAAKRVANTTAMFNGLMPTRQQSRLSQLQH
jgi:hypothetical protein